MAATRRRDPSATMIRASLLSRLDASDRALFLRWVLRAATPRPSLRRWRALTHVGGLRASIAAILIPAAFGGPTMQVASLQAAITLILSHLVVQVVKRSVVRERPQLAVAAGNHVVVPDRFSFPSGHSCAVMSVAIVYAIAVPDLAAKFRTFPSTTFTFPCSSCAMRLDVLHADTDRPGGFALNRTWQVLLSVPIRNGHSSTIS
jgi:undecaprenyl-diphosphatase